MRRYVVTTALRDYDDFDSTAKTYFDASAAAKAVSEVLWAFATEWFSPADYESRNWGFFPERWQFAWDDGDGETENPTEKQKYEYFLSEVLGFMTSLEPGDAVTVLASQSYHSYGNELTVTFGPVEVA